MKHFETIEKTVQYPLQRDVSSMGIGIVGASRIVREKHLPAYRKAGFRVVGLTDLIPEAARSLAEKHDIPKVFPDLESLLADPDIAIIDCAIPSDGRLAVVEAVAAAGKPLLMHKPLAYTYEEGRQFVDVANRHGIPFAVNQNARWAPTYGAATQLLRTGVIGDPYWIHHQLLSGFDWFNPNPWHQKLERWQMHQYGIHHFDILSVWLGRQPSTVYAHTTRRPQQAYRGDMLSTVSCGYHDELQAVLQETNALHPARPWATHFEIHGPKGCIVSENLDRISLYTEETGTEGAHHQFGISWFPDAFTYPMYELMTAVLDGREPAHSAASTLPTLATVDAAYASAESGSPVQLQ